MITTNVIQRTFHIRVGDSTGTCFTIDVDNKQYIVTAKHIAKTINENPQVKLFHGRSWKVLNISLIGHCDDPIDISVLATDIQLSPTYSLSPTSANLIYGQDVYFLGFPYGLGSEAGDLNRDFPLPFVKKAIVSQMDMENKIEVIYLDGHNNPGFSGEPVVFRSQGSRDFKVCSVISVYRYQQEHIYNGDEVTPLYHKYNTGIIVAYGIQYAVSLIQSNSTGYHLLD